MTRGWRCNTRLALRLCPAFFRGGMGTRSTRLLNLTHLAFKWLRSIHPGLDLHTLTSLPMFSSSSAAACSCLWEWHWPQILRHFGAYLESEMDGVALLTPIMSINRSPNAPRNCQAHPVLGNDRPKAQIVGNCKRTPKSVSGPKRCPFKS